MSFPIMELSTWFLGLFQGEPGETGPPGRVSGVSLGVGLLGHLGWRSSELPLPGSARTYWSCGTSWPSWPFRPCGE